MEPTTQAIDNPQLDAFMSHDNEELLALTDPADVRTRRWSEPEPPTADPAPDR